MLSKEFSILSGSRWSGKSLVSAFVKHQPAIHLSQ
jgi:hypothetical protein